MLEPESDVERTPATSKRKASEMEFEIPPAKRTEPAEDSVTESESGADDVLPRSRHASVLALNLSKGTVAVRYEGNLCLSRLVTVPLRGSSPADDSVTESESDGEPLTEAVRVCQDATLGTLTRLLATSWT